MEKNIVDYFISLVKIDSESRFEKELARKIEKDLIKLGAETNIDDSHEKTGGDVGNLYAFFEGTVPGEPILLCAHMDTVVPGKSVKPIIEQGKIKTDGTTILGSDDKSGIAQIIWGLKTLKEKNIQHKPIEVLFTISEEIGLLGAKNFNYDQIKSKMAFALDIQEIGSFMNVAPSQNALRFIVYGKEAHAGVEPEKGVNAIVLASEAICNCPMGRIDKETTANIGYIKGGTATNIVPNKVEIKGEVRSHNPTKLHSVTSKIIESFNKVMDKYKSRDFQPKLEIFVETEFHQFSLDEDEPVLQLAKKVTEKLGIEYKTLKGGGGSDANVFNQRNIKTVVAGTGMNKIHSVEEYIEVSDLELGAKWIEELIKTYSES